ncbi:TorF family putative porin [uncultured Paraglaciecola sp.]|uniref:TorF family putative porin n=1 Tax=uncultured Paraglaciecola sp. TaxID=1765024 RepID=UPI0030D9FAD8|tara:strand:- start:8413 stop:9135 length:723 start_codon:yes stop_codon:yes gene_type:complete
MNSSMKKTVLALALTSATLIASAPSYAEVTANASVTSNYIWRGLTQTTNDAAVQGGIDYADESGFYVGTWVSNVNYGADDVYSYEHDMYFGFSGESGDITYDVGYLYYNYDSEANFDFAEVYGSVGYGGLSATLSLLAHTEADEGEGRDYGFAQASYISVDYGMPVLNGAELGLHVGYHQGDFAEDFNGVPDGYADWGVSIAKDGFSFAVTGTDLDDTGADAYDNDSIKFSVGYGVDFEL